MVLRARGPLGTSPIDGELKNIWTVLFSDFFDHGDAGSDPFFDPTKKSILQHVCWGRGDDTPPSPSPPSLRAVKRQASRRDATHNVNVTQHITFGSSHAARAADFFYFPLKIELKNLTFHEFLNQGVWGAARPPVQSHHALPNVASTPKIRRPRGV